MGSIVRGDISESVRKHGCCLYVGNSLSFVQIEVRLPNIAAALALYLDVYILAVYRPPSSCLLQDEDLISFISNICVGRKVVILRFQSFIIGLECRKCDWWLCPPREMLFFSSFSLFGLSQ